MTQSLKSASATASAIVTSGPVTLIGDAAHDAAILARYEAAELVMRRAMANDRLNLSSRAYLAADAQRQTYRDCIASMRSRIGA